MSETTSVLAGMSLVGLFFLAFAFLIRRFGAERIVTTIDWSRVSDPARANRGYFLGMILLGLLQIAWGIFMYFALSSGHKDDVGAIGTIAFVAALLTIIFILIVHQARWQDRPPQWKQDGRRR